MTDPAASCCPSCERMFGPRNAPRLQDVSEKRTSLRVLYPVVEVISEDDVCRVERLECGHTKTTMTASRRPAKRRRCLKCEHGEGVK